MTKACQLMGEHGSEPLGIQSQHEPRSSERRPSPQLVTVAVRWHLWVSQYCVVEWNKARCGSRRAEYICKHTCTADTDNGYVANGQTLSFDNKALAKGDVFAAIAKSVFLE